MSCSHAGHHFSVLFFFVFFFFFFFSLLSYLVCLYFSASIYLFHSFILAPLAYGSDISALTSLTGRIHFASSAAHHRKDDWLSSAATRRAVRTRSDGSTPVTIPYVSLTFLKDVFLFMHLFLMICSYGCLIDSPEGFIW